MEETGKFSDLEESFMESKLRILISDDDKALLESYKELGVKKYTFKKNE